MNFFFEHDGLLNVLIICSYSSNLFMFYNLNVIFNNRYFFTILRNCTIFQFNKLQVYKIYNVYKVYKFTCLQNCQSNATYNF